MAGLGGRSTYGAWVLRGNRKSAFVEGETAGTLISAGKPDELIVLMAREAQTVGEPQGHLLGWAALSQLDLLDGGRGAADALGEVLLRKVEGTAALLDPAIEGALYCSHIPSTPHIERYGLVIRN